MSENNGAHKSEGMIEVPAPTPWPLVTAFGLTLIFAGVVTSLGVSFVGLLVLLRGAVGWFRNVFPVPQEEMIQVRRTVVPITPSTRRVDHLEPGTKGHRVNIPVMVPPYSAGLLGGVLGGVPVDPVGVPLERPAPGVPGRGLLHRVDRAGVHLEHLDPLGGPGLVPDPGGRRRLAEPPAREPGRERDRPGGGQEGPTADAGHGAGLLG